MLPMWGWAGRDAAGFAVAPPPSCSVRPGYAEFVNTIVTQVFAAEEAPRLGPGPVMPYDLPIYSHPKVHRDGHLSR